MHKLSLLVAILMTFVVSMVLFVGCQESELSDEELETIYDMLRIEVENQVSAEVTSRVDNLDELTVSRLNIADEDGNIVAILEAADTGGALYIKNKDGEPATTLMSSEYGGSLMIIQDSDLGDEFAGISTLPSGCDIFIRHLLGEWAVQIATDAEGGGRIATIDGDGNTTFLAPK